MSARIAPILHGLRFPLFLFFATACVAAIIFMPHQAPWPLVLCVFGAFALALVRLRNAALALAAALAPLPGILWFGAAGYVLAIAFTTLMAAAYTDALLKADDPVAALWKPVPALAGALLFAAL